MSTPNKLGTKLTSEQQAALVARTGVAPPLPVIPTTWLAPHEQRFAVLALFGLVEVGSCVEAREGVEPHSRRQVQGCADPR